MSNVNGNELFIRSSLETIEDLNESNSIKKIKNKRKKYFESTLINLGCLVNDFFKSCMDKEEIESAVSSMASFQKTIKFVMEMRDTT